MNFLRKIFRVERPSLHVADMRDPEEDHLIEQQNRHIQKERARLRTKLQKVQVESRMLKMAGGALQLMENDSERR